MNLLGINKSRDEPDINDGESPENSNCFFAKGKKAILGQRLGKVAFNTTPYAEVVQGVVPAVRSNGNRRWYIAKDDGNVDDDVAAISAVPVGGGTIKLSIYPLEHPFNLSLANPTGFVTETINFVTPIPITEASNSDEYIVSFDYTVSAAASTGSKEITLLYISLELLDSGDNPLGLNMIIHELDNVKDTVSLSGSGYWKKNGSHSGEATKLRASIISTGGIGVTDNTASLVGVGSLIVRRSGS